MNERSENVEEARRAVLDSARLIIVPPPPWTVEDLIAGRVPDTVEGHVEDR